MLSDDVLEKLIQPLINRQEAISNYVIKIIADRIKELGEVSPSDVNRLERLFQTGADVQKINAELSRLTGLQEQEIKHIIRVVAEDAYADTKAYYDYRYKSFIPYDKNIPLQRIVKSIERQTLQTYRNLSQSRAFMIRDLANPKKLIPTPLSKTYQTVLDEAVQASQQGIVDYQTAMRRTLKQLIDSGIRTVTYYPESGRVYTQRLDTAVRRNILDGIRAINQGVQDETGRQYGADGKEISVHLNPAPDHEPVQGHQFTNEEYEKLQNDLPFEDLLGNKFEPIERAIGTYNCRHFTYSIIAGFTKPNYTPDQLQRMIERNQEGYTDSKGRHRTLYECTQYQRQLETRIRRGKDGQIAARASGDIELAKQYQAQIDRDTALYKTFSANCKIPPKPDRLTVSGYHRISTK